MNKMRVRATLLSCFLGLTAAAHARGADCAQTDSAAAVHFTNNAAVALNGRREALEKRIIAQLTGKKAETFDQLKKDFGVLKADFVAAQGLPEAEKTALAHLLLCDEQMLMDGAALARGSPQLDPQISGILAAASAASRGASARAVSAILHQLTRAEAARDPAASNRVFDNLRRQLASDPAAAAKLDAVQLDMGRKPRIQVPFVQPTDPLYARTNAARLSVRTNVPPIPSPAASVSQPPPSDPAKIAAVNNCKEALNTAPLQGELWSSPDLSGLCDSNTVHATMIAGLVDAVHQQFGTVGGLISNFIFLLGGIAMDLMTGGVSWVLKLLVGIGFGLWALYKIVPPLIEAWNQYKNSKEGSVERYKAIRTMFGIFGGILIMLVMTLIGGAIGKMIPKSFGTALGGVSSKIGARLPEGFTTMTSKVAEMLAPKRAPLLEGASHVTEAPGKPAPLAAHSPEKGYTVVTEEGGGPASMGKASRAAHDAVVQHLENVLKSGKKPTVAEARAALADAMTAGNAAARAHATPADPASVNLVEAIVARGPHGEDVLVSAKAGAGDVFIRRGGTLEPQPLDAAVPVTEPLGSPRFRAPTGEEMPFRALKPSDVVFAANKAAAADALGAHDAVPAETTGPKYVKALLRAQDELGGEAAPRAVAELRMPIGEKPSALSWWMDRAVIFLQGVTGVKAPQLGYVPILPSSDAPTQPQPQPTGPVDPSEIYNPKDVVHRDPQDHLDHSTNDRPKDPDQNRPPVDQTNAPTSDVANSGGGSGGGGGGGAGASQGGAGGHDPKAPDVKLPGGGNMDGAGGGSGGGAAGGSGVDGGARGPGADTTIAGAGAPPENGNSVDAAPAQSASPAPFTAAMPARRSAATLNGGTPAGGQSREPSVASRYDGSGDRLSSAVATASALMHGLGGGDALGLPRLPPTPPAIPVSAGRGDAAPQDRNAGSAIAPRAATQLQASAHPGADEDFNDYTYLAPARQSYDMPVAPAKPEGDWRYLAALLARMSAASAAAYLLMHSDVGYLAGVVRRRRDDA
jgi:hypothetical protein